MCIYIYIYIHTMQTSICLFVFLMTMYVLEEGLAYIYVHTCIYIYTHTYICMCMRMCVCVCVCGVCVRACVGRRLATCTSFLGTHLQSPLWQLVYRFPCEPFLASFSRGQTNSSECLDGLTEEHGFVSPPRRTPRSNRIANIFPILFNHRSFRKPAVSLDF